MRRMPENSEAHDGEIATIRLARISTSLEPEGMFANANPEMKI